MVLLLRPRHSGKTLKQLQVPCKLLIIHANKAIAHLADNLLQLACFLIYSGQSVRLVSHAWQGCSNPRSYHVLSPSDV